MLMPRLQYHLNGYSPEMSIALSMQHQQQHINQLLNTAAAATGIVGDVDALLTPIPNNNHPPARMETGRERNLWRTNEIMEVLTIMQEINALDMLNHKAMKSELVFRKVERIMHTRGFRKKSHIQISTKWKFLKSTYRTSRRNGIIPKMIPQAIYEELHKMLQNANNSCSGRSISDCGNSATSVDGDNSNGATVNGSDGINEGQLIISGVEGGYGSGSKNSLDGAVEGHQSDEENGLAHPIFGFRLGLVKQEPADTGYESSMVKEKNSTANIQFQTEIKQEVNEDSDSPVASTTATPQPPVEEQLEHPQPQQRQSIPEIMILSRRTVRHSPAATTTTATSKPNVTTTPKTTATITTQPNPNSTSTASPTPLPPLRIAPFAKVPPSEITTPISTANLPPPPPLAMNPTSRALRLSSAYSSGVYANTAKGNAAAAATSTNTNISAASTATYQRKLTTNNPRGLTIAASERPPTVQPYLRRHEIVVPDLDIAAAPHEYRATQPFYGFPDGPSTSQQAQQHQSQQMEARKHRLKPSLMINNTMPAKRLMRMPEMHTKPAPRQAKLEFVGAGGGGAAADIGDDGLNSSSDEESNDTYQPPPQQQRQEQRQEQQASLDNVEREQSYARVLQDIAISLRQMQREVINEFFKRQMKLAREEHEYQMRQDDLLMKAFKEQSLQFQQLGKQMLGSAVKLEKRKKRLEKQERKQIINHRKMETRQMQKNECKKGKFLLNGSGKPKVQNKEVVEKNEKGVKILMKNLHAQLGLTEDEDGDDEQNQYEYDVSEYLQANSNDMEQTSFDMMNRHEEHNEETEDDAEGNYRSEPIIVGH
ncbi:uncharacterized protein LOC129249113 [Anastrepha obliqua]|uniref:uncharacterized protein LOC129249113 n=1 Tax=Anastrepha obliqua TaxID=95512 RepID=UPI0024099484|nr:uncharacterized protein LOC129249113 [Anastrepha obliqua]XP_054744738.1 uncharacterized protein LOC129249113 [Anastrepha obliqua]XP_054744746.1 uncharacterized protein LOC129249113 [Anastrepha obliqua]XP_054744753.1 uncharacterized protein LOC129249113 [Anastrepha obliqua]